MAIHLFCHTSHELAKTDRLLKEIAAQNQELFLEKFLISNAMLAKDLNKEMAAECGINAQSTFLIRVNDKSATDLVPEVVAIVRDGLGFHDVAVLWENEIFL